MQHGFDKGYWESHWQQAGGRDVAPHPYLARETGGLVPGTALDAGCGEGAEAIWLATEGWQVTAADISSAALARATERAAAGGTPSERLRWVEADLSVWEPDRHYDLVTTHYAHPAMPQLDFYERIAGWVAPGGTLLVVGHLHIDDHGHGHGHQADPDGPPEEATATAAGITARLDLAAWDVVTADEPVRTVAGRPADLHDVVVRATRRT